MSNIRSLPLFPLSTVLFPGMALPLHIFEPRYKLMIGRCMELNQPFGVVLIKEGVEVGGAAIPYSVGTSAYITHAERDSEGRINIQTIGYQRFKLLEIQQTAPYMVGMVEDFPVEEAEDPTTALPIIQKLRPMLHYYLDVLTQETEMTLTVDELPEDGLALAYFVAITLPLPTKEKQQILEEIKLTTILSKERVLLRREVALLEHMRRQPPPETSAALPFSKN